MMYRLLKNVKGLTLGARDGEIGRVTDVFLDDAEWGCRYLVVKTGSWLNQRHVLITPHAVQRIDWDRAEVNVALTRDQIRSSPDIDTDKPVSRQKEVSYFDHYGYPYYWTGPYVWGPYLTTMPAPAPASPASQQTFDQSTRQALERRALEREKSDPHLRSTKEIAGYEIKARDGEVGELDDLLFEEDDWTIRFLVIDTRKWLPGKQVVVPVDCVDEVSWSERGVFLDLTKEDVRNSPQFDPLAELTAENAAGLYAHYGRFRPHHAGVR